MRTARESLGFGEFALSRTYLQNRHFLIAIAALLLACCAAFLAACSGSATVDAVPGAAAGSGGDGSGEAGADNGGEPGARELVFVPITTTAIHLKPKASRRLTVQTIPAGVFRIRFALEGEFAADAVLDASEVQTDADGIAQVTLIAPSEPSTFSVRASSTSGAQVKQGVSVDATGTTALRVQPSYSGQRKISDWVATARRNVSCSELPGNPPPDGNLQGKARFNAPLEIKNVPVGVALAVTVRAGHYIGGCADVPALSEADGNQVLVYASDRPLSLAATNLSLRLGATDPHPEFDKLIKASASLAESSLLGSAKNDVAALLDEMHAATSAASREAFDVARMQNGWESALESAFGKSAARRMRDPAQRWLTAGLLALDAPDALVGQLLPLGSGVSFTPSAVGTATPSSAGFPGFFVGTWSADSNDTLLLGMELNWQPSRLLTALAVAPALLDFPEASSAERALALSVDCAQVGQVLLANGENPASAAFADCDASCASSLCSAAVAAAWGKAELSSGAAITTLSITASGSAEVGDDAEATEVDGSWVGELRTADGTAQVSGSLSASSSAP